jgi:hypothetical protein
MSTIIISMEASDFVAHEYEGFPDLTEKANVYLDISQQTRALLLFSLAGGKVDIVLE